MWFSRGWTLQELIAPRDLWFYDKDWTSLGSRSLLSKRIEVAVKALLIELPDFRSCSIAKRMSWASRRQTTREEDIAYCLLGLFDINMPLVYGEGPKAFTRLQLGIMKHSNDESIFAWESPDHGDSELMAVFLETRLTPALKVTTLIYYLHRLRNVSKTLAGSL